MKTLLFSVITTLLMCSLLFSQGNTGFNQEATFIIKGTVKGKENFVPIEDVEVFTNNGQATKTDVFGQFKIRTSVGDLLTFRSDYFDTIDYWVRSNEDVDVLVEGYSPPYKRFASKGKDRAAAIKVQHQKYLDSAQIYKSTDIARSLDYVAKSIALLSGRGNTKEWADSYGTLGEVYYTNGQYDLAITNFKQAQKAKKTTKIALLLAGAHLRNEQPESAQTVLVPLTRLKQLSAVQRIDLYEKLGDAKRDQSELNAALDYYKQSLLIAEKNQLALKEIDLNSKIAITYADADRNLEAEGYFDNSLRLSQNFAPQRLVEENEKVADFYNQKNRYQDEIVLRKKSLNTLEQLPVFTDTLVANASETDVRTAQRINYKIGNAYILQDKLEEAIPYLERSIVEADEENDLVVQKDATRKLSEVYRNKGDFDKALASYQNYVAVVDSLYVRKEQEISRASRFNREISNQENRISSLEQERELSQSRYNLALTEQRLFEESNKRQKWLIYSLLFGLLLLGLTSLFLYKGINQQRLANNVLALKSLRSQMNPHFIFNALNSVNNYIAKNDERSANRFLSDFSVLMRRVLENSEEDFIPMSKEMELLELYVKLEHSRFPDKFEYQIQVDETVDKDAFLIPPMLLQPYIENAIWHGLRYKEEKGFLNVTVSEIAKDTLGITIVDNGIGRKKSMELKTKNQLRQRSKGMGNIKRRIEILNGIYKNKLNVSISDATPNGEGTKVYLTLKK